jgi:5-formyltetrahydrofolate cyclo-ligase
VIVDPAEIDFAIIPGLAFDRHGNRLGRGAGYYDRYLRHCRAVRCGVCHDIMLLDSIPVGNDDVPMDIIVTDKSLIRFKKTEETNA